MRKRFLAKSKQSKQQFFFLRWRLFSGNIFTAKHIKSVCEWKIKANAKKSAKAKPIGESSVQIFPVTLRQQRPNERLKTKPSFNYDDILYEPLTITDDERVKVIKRGCESKNSWKKYKTTKTKTNTMKWQWGILCWHGLQESIELLLWLKSNVKNKNKQQQQTQRQHNYGPTTKIVRALRLIRKYIQTYIIPTSIHIHVL